MTSDDFTRLAPLRVRSQALAQELYTRRVREERPLDAAIRRSLKGRRHA